MRAEKLPDTKRPALEVRWNAGLQRILLQRGFRIDDLQQLNTIPDSDQRKQLILEIITDLRRIYRSKTPVTRLLDRYPESYIQDIILRATRFLPQDQHSNFIESLNRPPLRCIRIRDYSAIPNEFTSRISPVPWLNDAFFVEHGQIPPDLLEKGVVVKHDAASQYPAQLIRSTDRRILDMSAGVGIKTLQIADMLTATDAELVVNEIDERRLEHNMRRVEDHPVREQLHFTNTDGQIIGNMYPESMDCVLLDAPCTSSGTLSKGLHGVLRQWTPDFAEEMAALQLNLLESGYCTLKPGGRIIYSTCSFDPLENEEVVRTFILHQPNALLVSRNGSHVHSVEEAALRFWPHTHGTIGFFVIAIEKPLST